MSGGELGCFIPQSSANKRIILATAERLGMEEERVIMDYRPLWQYDCGNDSVWR